MKEKELDELDKKLVRLLIEDGRMSVGTIAKSLEITPPTVRARIETLVRSGVMRVASLLNAFKTKGLTTALVGIRLEKHEELDSKTEMIAGLSQVHWAAIVTGRYDIFAEVILTDGMLGLYRFLSEELPKLGGISSSESFMVMKSKNKWILLPEGAQTSRKWT